MTHPRWARCRAWLLPAFGAEVSEAEVTAQLAAGQAQLWIGERSAMVTQIHQEAGLRLVHVLLGGGELEELLVMRVGVEAWARAMGCDWATINGRAGWTRALRRLGFAPRDGELWKRL